MTTYQDSSLSLTNYIFSSYGSGQDIVSNITVQDNGNTIQMVGNTWKKIDFKYNVTANTILEFDFKSTLQGEEHGIGFDSDNLITTKQIFNLYGTQQTTDKIYNYQNYANSAGEWKHYTIDVGYFFTGVMNYLTFMNDQDVKNPTAESIFSNIKIYEKTILKTTNDIFTTNEDTSITIVAANLLSNDSGDALTLIEVGTAVNGTVTLDGNRNVIFVPNSSFNGNASFVYTIVDRYGTKTTGTANVTVDPVNDPPVAVNDVVTTNEDTFITILAADLLKNDTDIDSNILTLNSVGNAVNGTVTLDQNGNVIFTPNCNFNGNASFNYTIADDSGLTSTATVNVTVNPVNDAPLAANDAFTSNQNTPITVLAADLLKNDTDIDSDILTLNSVGNAVNGTVTLDNNGNIIFTPCASFIGNAQFDYTISDGKGGTSIGKVTVAVNPNYLSFNNYTIQSYDPTQDVSSKLSYAIQDNNYTLKITGNAWKKIDFPYTLSADTVIEFDFKSSIIGDVHGIGFDIDNAISPDLTFKLYGTQVWGINNYNNYQDSGGTWKHYKIPVGEFYTGKMNYLTFTNDHDVSNPTAESLFSNLRVYESTDVKARNDILTTDRNKSLNITRTDLLANDCGNNLSVLNVGNATNGSVTLDTNGNVIFTPSSNFLGEGTFDYTIQDLQGNTATAKVKVNIIEPLRIGTNLAGIADWSTQLPFIDGFKSSRSWMSQNSTTWSTGESLNLDENGWVKSLPTAQDGLNYTKVGTLLYREIGGHYPGGKYIVLYDGEGKIEYSFDGKKDLSTSKPNRDVINVTPSNNGIYLSITQTDPNHTGNYIRNIRVIPEAYETTYQSQLLNPTFLNKTDSYQALRFMDWMKTNNSTISQWSDRPTLDNATWATKGAPVEVMVELANRLDIDPWFNMPHQATNEYITNFATYVRDHLESGRKVYVEYSNEVWNSQFQQYSWVDQQSKAANLPNWLDWYGKRTTEITGIWDQVFGQDKERVIGVLGAQASNTWTASQTLDYLTSTTQKSATDLGIDAIAIAPYFGIVSKTSQDSVMDNWTLDDLFNNLENNVLPSTYQNMKNYKDLATKNNLDLVAYEGGQHLVASNDPILTNLFIQANRDPRMGQLYQEYLTQWHQIGGGLFMNFNDICTPSKWGMWGALEYLDQVGSPKYDALMNLINSAQ